MDHPLYIVGAGGIGCALGYALADKRPTLVDANPAKVAWGNQHGLVVEGKSAVPLAFADFHAWRPEAHATILLCTKCYDNAAVLPKLPAGVNLIPVQNGFDRALQPGPDDIEGIASFVSECHAERPVTRITRPGSLHLGPRHPGGSPLARERLAWLLEALRGAPFRVHAVEAILPFKYTKLLYNAAISPLAAAAGIDNGQLLSVGLARRLFFALLKENHAILVRAGIALDRIGPFHPRTVQRILSVPGLANLLAVFFYPSLRGSYCSMANDLPRGQTEIEYYNRHLVELAGAGPCPLNRRVVAMIETMQRERAQPALSWLEQLQEAA